MIPAELGPCSAWFLDALATSVLSVGSAVGKTLVGEQDCTFGPTLEIGRERGTVVAPIDGPVVVDTTMGLKDGDVVNCKYGCIVEAETGVADGSYDDNRLGTGDDCINGSVGLVKG